MTAAEMKEPTKNIPRAIKGVYIRILVFYIAGVFVRAAFFILFLVPFPSWGSCPLGFGYASG